MSITFNIRPNTKPRMTQRDSWKTPPRLCVAKYRAFKDELNIQAKKLNYVVTPVLSITFVFSMPKSWSKKKRLEMDGAPHQSTPDLDNIMKAFKDSLCENDSFVHTYRECKKIWGTQDQIIVFPTT
ncbi:MAG: RusA family crossover junction endodeoxyribonuclease [Steroidobacteraceae bacterium]